MTTDDALRMMCALDAQEDGTEETAGRVALLRHVLTTQPEIFWECYWHQTTASDPTRRKTEELIRSGVVTERTTFGELAEILQGGHDR
jgi:hypothetical protein